MRSWWKATGLETPLRMRPDAPRVACHHSDICYPVKYSHIHHSNTHSNIQSTRTHCPHPSKRKTQTKKRQTKNTKIPTKEKIPTTKRFKSNLKLPTSYIHSIPLLPLFSLSQIIVSWIKLDSWTPFCIIETDL